MSTAARIESSLGFNDSEFLSGIARAEQRAQTFSNRATHSFEKLFKRTPGRKAELAVSGLLQDVSSGNLSQGIAQFAGKISGLGLVAGVGLAAAAEGFYALREHIIETRKAEEELETTLSRPLQLVVRAGGATELIATLSKQADELQKKYGSFSQHLLDAFKFSPLGGKAENEEGLRRQRLINEAAQQANEAAKLEGRQTLIRSNVLSGIDDPARRALAEQRFKFDEREAQIRAHPDKGTKAKLEALNVEAQAAEKVYKQRSNLRDAALESQKREIAIAAAGLDPERQKLALIREQIRALDERLKLTTNPEDREAIKTQRAGKSVELTQTLFARAKADIQRTPEEREAALAGQLTDQHLHEFFERRGRITPGDRDLATQMGGWEAHLRQGTWDAGSTGESVDAAKPMTREDLDAVMQKYWGK